MMHLTYNRRNPLGDGCGELRDGGLSDFGLAVVGEMNRLGVIIDLAHTGWQTCLDAARASNQPLVVSHSGAWELGRHARCKTDEVIRAVVDTGGTMGITNVPQFLGGKGDISTMLDHVDYVIKKFGVEAVTIGTDRSYRSRESADSEQKLSPRLKKHTRWEGLRPPGQEVHMPEWRRPEQVQSLAWTNWPLFTVGLVQRGYSDEDIAKIIGGNLLRVVRQVWK
jgi:membrane dipeptidase